MNIREIISNIYNKFFNKKEKQRLLEEKDDRITQRKYERARGSGKTYKCSDKRLKEIRRKKVIENEKKKSFKKKLREAVIGGTAMLAVAGIGCSLNNKEINTKTTQQPQPVVETQTATESTEYDKEDKIAIKDINDIIDMYNEKYPDANITKNDLGIIEQKNVAYLVKEKSENGEVKYIENSWNTEALKENQKYIYSNDFDGGYVLLANDKVIASVAKVEDKISNVEVKRISNGKKEYLASDKYYNFEEPESVMEPLKEFHKERSNQLER